MSDTKPEFSVGPVTGGLFLNVWRNEVKTDDGPRTIRNVQIARRFSLPQLERFARLLRAAKKLLKQLGSAEYARSQASRTTEKKPDVA